MANHVSITEALRSSSFEGTTGTVTLDANGDRLNAFYKLVNAKGGSMEPAGTINSGTGEVTMTAGYAMNWPGGVSGEAPKDYDANPA